MLKCKKNNSDAKRLLHKFLFYNTFITFLYMFRALLCSSSGGQIVLYGIWYRDTETSEWSKVTELKVKVKWSRYRPGVAQRVGRCIAIVFHDRGTGRWWVVSSTPRPHFTCGERPGTHCTGGWVGPRAGLDGRKISSPPGFDPGPSSLYLSRYTNWATGPTKLLKYNSYKYEHIVVKFMFEFLLLFCSFV